MHLSNIQYLHPWSENRTGYHRWLVNGEGVPPQNTHFKLSLKELAENTSLFAKQVEPVWDTLKGRSAEDIAATIFELLTEIDNSQSLSASIKLYQVLFSDWMMHFGTWNALDSLFCSSKLSQSETIFEFLTSWVEEAPDRNPIDSALFLLARTTNKPNIERLMELTTDPRLAVGVAAVVRRQYDADEDLLIKIAKMHKYGARVEVLALMQTVNKEDHQNWLLEEGYDSGAEYNPCAYYAAIHGRLIERLRANRIDSYWLQHFASVLSLMCDAYGGSESWKTIADYENKAEAFDLLFNHIVKNNEVEANRRSLRNILKYLAYWNDGEDELNRSGWEESARKKYRSLFVPPWLPESETLAWLWWERPEPTIDDLWDGKIDDLNKIVSQARGDKQQMSELVDWAISYLYLRADPNRRDARKRLLSGERLPGVCLGGIAGVSSDLGSIYGQVLLQLSMALKDHPNLGGEILAVALETDYPHLPKTAAEAYRGWQDAQIPEAARALLKESI